MDQVTKNQTIDCPLCDEGDFKSFELLAEHLASHEAMQDKGIAGRLFPRIQCPCGEYFVVTKSFGASIFARHLREVGVDNLATHLAANLVGNAACRRSDREAFERVQLKMRGRFEVKFEDNRLIDPLAGPWGNAK